MKVADQFGHNLAYCRRRAKLSQEELAVRASLHRTAVGQLERGERVARVDTVIKLAGSLGIPPEELLDGMGWDLGGTRLGSVHEGRLQGIGRMTGFGKETNQVSQSSLQAEQPSRARVQHQLDPDSRQTESQRGRSRGLQTPILSHHPDSTTHYAPSGAVPGPHLDDPQGHQGLERFTAGPPAADFGTALPCGGHPYGGPAGSLTFGLFRAVDEFLESHPTHLGLSLDNRGMDSKVTPPAFFTERSLAAYLAVSDRTIRNWIRRGELASYKLGASRRIDPADVDVFLAERRDEAA